ncbi:hypothetical protein MRX96_023779 [Rhipicephalus microplus]
MGYMRFYEPSLSGSAPLPEPNGQGRELEVESLFTGALAGADVREMWLRKAFWLLVSESRHTGAETGTNWWLLTRGDRLREVLLEMHESY